MVLMQHCRQEVKAFICAWTNLSGSVKLTDTY